MENTVIKKMLQDFYHDVAYTDKYILGYVNANTVFFTIADREIVNEVTYLDRASRGQGYALRFKPNRYQKAYLMATNAVALCSVEFFNDMIMGTNYNKGEIFEKLVTEYYGQVWEKDNIPFTDDGDITVDGTAYQIKFEKATFTNEKFMHRFMEKG